MGVNYRLAVYKLYLL